MLNDDEKGMFLFHRRLALVVRFPEIRVNGAWFCTGSQAMMGGVRRLLAVLNTVLRSAVNTRL